MRPRRRMPGQNLKNYRNSCIARQSWPWRAAYSASKREGNKNRVSRKNRPTQRSHRVCTAVGVSRRDDNRSVGNNACVVCQRDNHKTAKCAHFARETIERRWFFVKKAGLCFKCLERGHLQTECEAPNCSHCERPHHALLHNPAQAGKDREPSTHGKHEASASSAIKDVEDVPPATGGRS